MQKIALMGAPTSGKTELAQQLKEALDGTKSVAVVDDYIAAIQERSDNTLGHFASYFGNIQAVVGRWEAERVAQRDRPSDLLVTCGTLVESVVYNAINALIHADMSEEGKLSLMALQNDRRASVSMSLMGIMAHDIYDYDKVFFLPLGETDNNLDEMVDSHIVEAAEALNVNYTKLPEERDQRLAIMLQEVLEVENTEMVDEQ